MEVLMEQISFQTGIGALASTRLWLLLLGAFAYYRIALVIYNAFFHPLAKFPGPRLRAVSALPLCWSMWSGYDHIHIKALHDKYGNVVRISPDNLSFIGPKAWQDIYGFSKDRKQIPKDVYWYLPENIHAPRSLINADDANHSRMRKLLAHAFSNQALREQEEILTGYFQLLMNRLEQQIDGPENGKVNLTRWFNFFTFDLIGDLALGKSFGMLEASRAPDFMEKVMHGSKVLIVHWTGQYIPIFGFLVKLYAKLPGSTDARRRLNQFAQQCAKQRMKEEPERKDFMSYILRYNDERGMTDAEIGMTAKTLLNAGSETTATALTACIWLLLSHEPALEKVTREVRDKFNTVEEINLQTSSPASLPYLFAVIEETLRNFSPLGGLAFRRRTAEPTLIDGVVIPPDTGISVPHYAASLSAKSWYKPSAFLPERWLDNADEKFSNDEKGATQSFSTGPRVCIGKNLAYAEMTSVLSRMLFNFDIELCNESTHWGKGMKTFNFWEKPPLMVKLSLSDKATATATPV